MVIGEETLEFHFCDGSTVTTIWKSTAKKDWWTDERRKAWSEYKEENKNAKCKKETEG